MKAQTELSESQVRWEPWKAMAVAAGVGAAIMGALIGITTLLVTIFLRGGGHSN